MLTPIILYLFEGLGILIFIMSVLLLAKIVFLVFLIYVQEKKEMKADLQRESKDNFIKFQQNIFSDNKNLNSRIYNIELSSHIFNRLKHSTRTVFDAKSALHVSITLHGVRFNLIYSDIKSVEIMTNDSPQKNLIGPSRVLSVHAIR